MSTPQVPAHQASQPSPSEKLLRFFAYAHLPERLQGISQMFYDLSQKIVAMTPASAEQTMCLRKLLEAKDCALRAAL